MASIVRTVTSAPRRGAAYFQGRRRGNAIPAILLLFGAVVLVLWIRQGAPPTSKQALTLVIAAGLIVAIGTVAPTMVVAGLAALFIAAVFNASSAVEGFLDRVQDAIGGLASTVQPWRNPL